MSSSLQRSNRQVAWRLGGVVLAMFGFGFAMVPLYDVFCEITGLNGKTGVASASDAGRMSVDRGREITVEFVATVNGAAGPWEFAPTVARMKVNPGAMYTTRYFARNLEGARRTGRAVPSVAPALASRYFDKTECFCFTRQEFAPKEGREMPLTFVIDPDIPPGVSTVTLSYTFFNADPA